MRQPIRLYAPQMHARFTYKDTLSDISDAERRAACHEKHALELRDAADYTAR